MPSARIAYMPLNTFPNEEADESILAATRFAAALDCKLHVTTFSVDIPQMASPLGGLFLNVPGIVRTAEENSREECRRLETLVKSVDQARAGLHCANREVFLGGALEAAAAEARYYDLAVRPWSGASIAAQDMTQSLVFGSGRPTILVPAVPVPAALDHIAIAWDGSRVAARALGDALALLGAGGRVSVLTVEDEKPLGGPDPAGALATSLDKRGLRANPIKIELNGKAIARGLQDAAQSDGAQLLAMGGFGHSRMRDFVLGGATKGILAELRLPVLLSH